MSSTTVESWSTSAAAGRPGGSRQLIIRLLVLVAMVGLVWGLRSLLKVDSARPLNRVQRVTLVQPARQPPPKPQDKPEEKPPEVKETPREQQVDVVAQAAAPGEAPRDDQLGVDADAEGTGDGFGLMGKRGARDITTLGGGGTGTAASGPVNTGLKRLNFSYYGGMVRQRIQNDLMALPRLRERDYVAVALVWIDPHGHINRTELPKSSGYPEMDSALRDAFSELRDLPEPPADMPQPVRLRITSKDLNAPRP